MGKLELWRTTDEVEHMLGQEGEDTEGRLKVAMQVKIGSFWYPDKAYWLGYRGEVFIAPICHMQRLCNLTTCCSMLGAVRQDVQIHQQRQAPCDKAAPGKDHSSAGKAGFQLALGASRGVVSLESAPLCMDVCVMAIMGLYCTLDWRQEWGLCGCSAVRPLVDGVCSQCAADKADCPAP